MSINGCFREGILRSEACFKTKKGKKRRGGTGGNRMVTALMLFRFQGHLDMTPITLFDILLCFTLATSISRTPKDDSHHILRRAVMFYIGDIYDAIGLKNLATEKLLAACKNNWVKEQFVNAGRFVFINTTAEKEKSDP